MGLFRKKPKPLAAVDKTALPRHVAIIMDGNGRWAQKRGLPRTAGHAAGAENFRTIATYCKNLGIPYLTVYAFSTENWKRPLEEVNTIMGLLKKYLLEAIDEMEKDRIRLVFLGDLTPLAAELQELYQRTCQIGNRYEPTIQVNVCINYGGRDELVRAVRRYAEDCLRGEQTPDSLTDDILSGYMDTAGLPDPDFIIRPSGELRMSNFLLWQSAYAEFYYTDTLWPDFHEAQMDQALLAYQKRQRRFGGV